MRISDWSSDVCSSDLILIAGEGDMYTAGNDVSDFASAGASDGPRNVDRFLRAIAACSLPLVAAVQGRAVGVGTRSEEHTSELQSLMRISYAVFCLKKKISTRKTSLTYTQTQNNDSL